jgi:ABC-type Fe3+/spermidine/putrescine transport system ATPase subunit
VSFLHAEAISQRFDGFVALRDISFSAEQGEFVTLLGPSGCGKSTLLNIIAGFLRPTTGRLHVGGRDITHLPPEARDSTMCFQSYALFPHLSVADNIAFGPRQKKVDGLETRRRVNSLLETIGLGPHREKLPSTLSGGQQQRVALARALAVQPNLVLFDEPLSNLDAKLRDQVRVEIRALQRELGFTALYVTHDQAEALAMSDKVLLLNNGVVEQAGAPKAVYFKPRTRFVADFIGAANIHDSPSTAFGRLPGPDGRLVCWRPEAARLGHAGPGTLTGRISNIAFQGAYTDVFVEAAGERARLQVAGDFTGTLGEALSFDVPPEAIVVLEG